MKLYATIHLRRAIQPSQVFLDCCSYDARHRPILGMRSVDQSFLHSERNGAAEVHGV
jgi:hypothetical protein